MSAFDIKTAWLKTNKTAVSELDATLARLQIFIAKRNVTEYRAHTLRPKPP
jgi:hypothetical protein